MACFFEWPCHCSLREMFEDIRRQSRVTNIYCLVTRTQPERPGVGQGEFFLVHFCVPSARTVNISLISLSFWWFFWTTKGNILCGRDVKKCLILTSKLHITRKSSLIALSRLTFLTCFCFMLKLNSLVLQTLTYRTRYDKDDTKRQPRFHTCAIERQLQ